MEGPWCRTPPGPRRNLLHHRPPLILRRPSVSADPAVTLPGARGSRLLDRRPPHYRCPAVPGLESPARAILPVRASAADAFTGVVLTDFAAARQFIPARPYCLSGLQEKPYPRNHRMSTL